MSTNNELPNNTQANSSYNPSGEGFNWIPIMLAIAALFLGCMWMWPDIFGKWTLDDMLLIKIAAGIAVIALGLKLNTWLKNKNEGAFDDKSMGGGGGGAPTSQSTTTIPELKSIKSQPLTKSHNMSYGAGKGAAKEVGHYRHEDKMGGGEADKMTLKGWGGNEGGGGLVDAAGRSAQKKPVRR